VGKRAKERYYDDLQSSLKELKIRIEQNKSAAFLKFKPELSRILEEEIAFHYRMSKGQIEVSLNRDNEILEAKRILSNPVEYEKLLSPN